MLDLLSKKFTALTVIALATGLLAVGVVATNQLASAAQSSNLTQKIKPTHCGQLPDCQLQPPTINNVHNSNHTFRVMGKYDHLNSQSLRLFFHGRWYVLGVDSQLSVSGDDWTLDLSEEDYLPLPPGDYDIEVSMVTLIGNTMTYTAHLRVAEPPDETDDDSDPSAPKPDNTSNVTLLPPSTGFMGHEKIYERSMVQSFFDSLAVSCVVCVLGIGSLVLAWRHNKR